MKSTVLHDQQHVSHNFVASRMNFAKHSKRIKTSLASEFAGVLSIEHTQVIPYVLSCENDKYMLYVSSVIENLGFAWERWLEKTDLRFKQLHEEDVARVERVLQRSIESGETFDCHYRLYDSKRNIRWFHDQASVVYDGDAMPLYLKGVMLDITDKKQMESELHEHRYYIDRKVEQRTDRLMKQMATLESCNATLCKKLEAVQQQLSTPQSPMVVQPGFQLTKYEGLDDVSELMRNMFGLRIASAGEIA